MEVLWAVLAVFLGDPLPPLSDADAFCCTREEARAVLVRQDAMLRDVRARQVLAREMVSDRPEFAAWWAGWEADLLEARRAWRRLELAKGATCGGDFGRRVYLGRLRGQIGDDYYTGTMPPPLPLWRLRRSD